MGWALAAGMVWMGLDVAWAEPVAVGLFVGSNQPGEGQQPLSFAVRDAQRFRSVMTEIGGLQGEGTLLVDPDAEELRDAFEAQTERLRALRDEGEQTVFVFYYSGHARSQSLTLGPSELTLTELRGQLEAMPSTVTVAVLDACQSGAISGIKGVEPVASFSYNSRATLQAEGLALLAWSTGSELSQESPELAGSFFTHHLVSGLRGPADRDRNGAVSLDEAYHYAYHRTLANTAPTRVGGQHVTLETQLRGQGEMVLTRPETGHAWVVFDGTPGRLLVVREEDELVVAEVVQAEGSDVSVTLPPGRFQVVGRDEAGPYTCDLSLDAGQRVQVSTLGCQSTPEPASVTVKAGSPEPRRFRAPALAVELGGGALRASPGGAFIDSMRRFGFHNRVPRTTIGPMASLSVAGRLHGKLAWVLGWSTLERATWRQEQSLGAAVPGPSATTYVWAANRVGAYARAVLPLHRDRLLLTAHAGGGVTIVDTRLTTGTTIYNKTVVGGHLAAGVGMQWVVPRDNGLDIGPFLVAEAIRSPALSHYADNNNRDVGGIALSLGLRVSP